MPQSLMGLASKATIGKATRMFKILLHTNNIKQLFFYGGSLSHQANDFLITCSFNHFLEKWLSLFYLSWIFFFFGSFLSYSLILMLHKHVSWKRRTDDHIYMLLTWRTVVQQLVSCPKSVKIHDCIVGHKQHPQAFVEWITFYRNKPWCAQNPNAPLLNGIS